MVSEKFLFKFKEIKKLEPEKFWVVSLKENKKGSLKFEGATLSRDDIDHTIDYFKIH